MKNSPLLPSRLVSSLLFTYLKYFIETIYVIETIQLIYNANQWPVFYMMGTKLVQKKHLIIFNKFLANVTILQLLKESINWKWDDLYSEYNRENIGQEWVK